MGSRVDSRASHYLLGDGLCSRNNRTILRREVLELGESPASFLSCNRTIVRTQRLAGPLQQLPAGRRVRTIFRGYKPAVRCVPAVKKK